MPLEVPQIAGDAGGAGVWRRSRSSRVPTELVVGCQIRHRWVESVRGPPIWTGWVLLQVPVKPSLFLIKYDSMDCVYSLEIFEDQRIQNLEIFHGVISSSPDGDAVESLVGRLVMHVFETDEGAREEWKGRVLSKVPRMPSWFFISYEQDPVLYMYELMDDLRDGDLHVLPEPDWPPADVCITLVGQQVELSCPEGSPKKGTIILQVENMPSIYFIMFHDDHRIYVYNIVMPRVLP